MSLREKIIEAIDDCMFGDEANNVWLEPEGGADAILALVRAHLTSDEAVERAVHKLRVAVHQSRVVGILPGRSDAEVMRLTLAAALGEGE
jgi:hypothetical protein